MTPTTPSRRAGAFSAAAAIALGGCAAPHRRAQPVPVGVELPPAPAVGHAGVALPDPLLTPGAVLARVGRGQVCRRGYAGRARDVPLELRQLVYRRYRIAQPRARYVIDHLVPLELGGANVAPDPRTRATNPTANLWPQPVAGRAGAGVKDALEDYLHQAVCAGRMSLRSAQLAIARDWYAAWLSAGRPGPRRASR